LVVLERERVQALEPVFDGVADGYRHYQKRISPSLDFVAPGLRLKWYEIAFASMPVSPELRTEARGFLLDEIEAGRFTTGDEIGFAILHDCGDVALLMVSTWRNSNELWETIYVKHKDNGGGFLPEHPGGLHRPAYCVWEMGAVAHEAQAWSRYLMSTRDDSALERYFFDMYSGMI
jgi:hypothetical protein